MMLLVELTDNALGTTRAFNVIHIVDIAVLPGTVGCRVTTAEHVEGVHVHESYEYVRDLVAGMLSKLYENGGET